tara:strand:+ start:63 stop:632 length:570 start_codon:yes stop_codon:yes gene_type:complete
MLKNIHPIQIGTYELNFDKELIYAVMQDYLVEPILVLQGGLSSYQVARESDFFLFDARLYSLLEQIYSKLNEYTNSVGLAPCRVNGSWFNKMAEGGKVNVHHHHGSIVSGALYVDVPNESSPLIFSNPSRLNRMMEIYPSNFFDYHHEPVAEGKLILFPSWLEHQTYAQRGGRTVISFNTEHTNAPNTF